MDGPLFYEASTASAPMTASRSLPTSLQRVIASFVGAFRQKRLAVLRLEPEVEHSQSNGAPSMSTLPRSATTLAEEEPAPRRSRACEACPEQTPAPRPIGFSR